MNWVRRIAAFAMAALSLAMLGCSKGGEQQSETLGLDIDVPITEEPLPADEPDSVQKGSPDTGAEGFAVVGGIAALAGAFLIISRKRS